MRCGRSAARWRSPRARAGTCSTRLLVPRARAPEAALVPGVEILGVESLQEAVDVLAGRAEPVPPPPPEPEPDARAAAGPVGRARPERAHPGARGHRRGRPQPLPARSARHRQDDAGPPAAVDPAAARPRRGARGHAHPVGRGPARGRRPRHRAGRSARPITRSPPPDWSGAARTRCPGEATLAHHGVLFLDELVRVRPSQPRGAAPAARGRARDDRARPAGGRVPDPVHARRRLQPVPVRARRRGAAAARRPTSRATSAGSAARCSTGSTC